MQSGYIIEAYSPSLNQSLRRLDLQNLAPPQDLATAQRDADTWALVQNRDQKMHVTDWQARVTWQDLGIETLPSYLFHTGI
jgi:hypothetical protein